ncbi:hypothetical protein BDN72DRAFT_264384 [Pluteus cervinus]|uniref:Uncharacterized protein n=1 Tax=Pluteus cervinus TaxID=181527 RepID=A0ACD3AFL3_9AGAR|nr:hypothetical protein BDN72DRAFT_264384 [Pluteus cervinus]
MSLSRYSSPVLRQSVILHPVQTVRLYSWLLYATDGEPSHFPCPHSGTVYIYISTVGQVELAKTWAIRCYLPSLILILDGHNISSSEAQELLGLLQGPSRSPRQIDVIGLGYIARHAIMEFMLQRNHPALEELVLRDCGNALPSLPTASTSLRRIYIHTAPETWRHSLPPSQLTVLWLTSMIHANALVAFLVNCPNLESLYVHIAESGLRPNPESQALKDATLPQLTYFGLENDYLVGGEPSRDLLQGFSFPSLRVAEYSVRRQSQASSLWPGFARILKLVGRLTLQFRVSFPSQDSFFYLLKHAPSLTELTISTNARFMSDTITSLASTDVMLPSLQTLYLDGSCKLTKWLSFQPQLAEFALAYPSSKPSLTRLVIQYRYSDPVNTEDL